MNTFSHAHFDALQTKLKCLNLLGIIFHIHTRDYLAQKNAPCLGVNNFHIWHVIDMGISQFESLFLFKKKTISGNPAKQSKK